MILKFDPCYTLHNNTTAQSLWNWLLGRWPYPSRQVEATPVIQVVDGASLHSLPIKVFVKSYPVRCGWHVRSPSWTDGRYSFPHIWQWFPQKNLKTQSVYLIFIVHDESFCLSNTLLQSLFVPQIYGKSMEYPTDFSRNANLKLGIKQLGENQGSWAEGWKAFQSGLRQENGFLFVTRQKCRFNSLRFICAVLRRFTCQGLTRWFIVCNQNLTI